MVVPFFSIQDVYKRQRHLLSHYLDNLFEGCDFVNGALVKQLEDAIKQYTGTTYAIAVSNASDGLAIAQLAAGIQPESEVIVPAMTFVSSASSVIHAGAHPVFADIDQNTYGLDPESVRSVITANTRALMVVHLFHQPAQMPALISIAKEFGLTIVEDSAESIGMWCDGVHTGLSGQAGVFSFFPTKTLGGMGDGGMIITDEAAVATACMQLRDHGRQPGRTGLVVKPGHSSRMDSIQAAILLARLEALKPEIERRAELADLYSQRLATLSSAIQIPKFAPRSYPCNGVWYVYVIECEHRDDLATFLTARGIGTEAYYPQPLHLQPAFAGWGHHPGDFPVAEKVCSRTLALPLYPGLDEEQVDFVCAAIAEFYGE